MAEVTASGLDEAMPLVASALTALRVVQHIQNPMCDSRHQAFGLPGQVMSARVDYFKPRTGPRHAVRPLYGSHTPAAPHCCQPNGPAGR